MNNNRLEELVRNKKKIKLLKDSTKNIILITKYPLQRRQQIKLSQDKIERLKQMKRI
jgi:uncharacterized protein YdaL